MSKNNFKKVNALLMAQNESPFINPRNAASGSMRLKNSNDIKHRQLEGIMYHISYIQKKDDALSTPIHTHQDEIDVLQKMGFKTVHQHFFITQDVTQMLSYCAAFEAQKNDLDFEIDGLVLKVNALPAQDILGMTSHHPRWAVAYKFKPDQVESRLESVDFQVGRTGVITPVAKIKPVYVGGVTVSSISLFNEENIKEKNLHVGDIVVIERAGEVIPYIVKNVSTQWQPDAVAITFPKNCPSCGVALMKSEQEANWRCTNAECTEQNIQKIIYFCSKEAMDIQFLGEAKVRQFYELGWLKTVPDIYRLPYHLMQQLDGWGAKSVANLQSAIEHSLSNPLHKIILGLGIPYVGKSTALTLCRHIQHLEELATISEEQLQQWEDIGPKVAQSIRQFFRHPYHQNMLSQLRDSGLSFNNTQRQTQHQSGSLSNVTFLFTGTLSTMKRSTAEELVKQNGGEILGSVSSKLHYLVVGDDAGSKLEKAKKMNTIRIITEAEFIDLIAAYHPTQNKDHKDTSSS